MSFKDEIISLQKRYVMPCVETWLDIPFVEGRGATLKDSEGREYVDLFAGIAVVNVGHCHPKVVEAIKRQAEKLTHLST
ncbi:MAG TPA: aminotransferase class III-fold pyridoxal phosphate-dependent enzyme, partial [Candidatus Bathyarchaeota archaeon]|nr:aminotransferase class III-fold pyridoxal phosphate-dependent enzyme [Candidatus Bathyarchaeota archaeon]